MKTHFFIHLFFFFEYVYSREDSATNWTMCLYLFEDVAIFMSLMILKILKTCILFISLILLG